MTTIHDPTKAPHVRRSARGHPVQEATHKQATLSPVERAKLAYELRVGGMPFSKIAVRCGYSDRGAAWNAVMRYAVTITPVSPAERDRRRPLEIAKLDGLWAIVEPNLGSADPRAREAAIRRALQLLDLYARWLEVKPSETPVASYLARYGLAVVP